jgi:hypothetical protein
LTNGGSGFTATATTWQPHGFSPLDQVTISGATPTDYNGTWSVTPLTDTTFQYTLSTAPNVGATNAAYQTGPPPPNQQQRILAAVNPPTYPVKYAKDLQSGLYIATATVDQSRYPNGHGISVGEVVYISKASFDGGFTPYSGYFLVVGVSTDKLSFQCVLPGSPVLGQDTGSSQSGYYGRLWAGGKCVYENNMMDMFPAQSEWFAGSGIQLAAGEAPANTNPVLFPQALMRRNVIRHMDGISDPLQSPLPPLTSSVVHGIFAFSCAGLITEENVVDLEASPSIQFATCGGVDFFANQTSAGKLLQGYTHLTTFSTDELTTKVEDTAVLAF